MPKRTDEFQSLIALMKAQLGPVGVRVTESKELRDRRTGKKREVDVVLESTIAGHPVVVGIECTKRARPATIEWVEQMAGKHENLPTDKLVLISKSGFRPAAIEDARLRGIDTFSIEAATSADWRTTMKLKTVLFRHHRFYPTDLRLYLVDSGLSSDLNKMIVSEVLLQFDDGERAVPLVDVIERALADPDTRNRTEDNGQTSIELAFKDGTYILTPSGSKATMGSVKFIVKYRERASIIPLECGSLAGTQVAFGTCDTPLGEVVVSIVEGDDKPATLAAKVIPAGKDEGTHLELRKE